LGRNTGGGVDHVMGEVAVLAPAFCEILKQVWKERACFRQQDITKLLELGMGMAEAKPVTTAG